MSLHVLFIAPSAYILSGLATWLDYILPGLKKYGWRTTLGLVEGPRSHRIAPYLEAHPQAHWVSIPCQTGTPQGRLRAVQRVVSQLQPDLVVTVNIPDAIRAVAELRSRGNSLPKVVMTCHGIQSDLFADMQLLQNSMDAVVCTNRLACRLAESIAGWPKERVLYAGYGTSIPALQKQTKHDILTLAYVGRLEQDQKRVHDLPPILDHLDVQGVPFKLLVAGTGPEEQALRKVLEKRLLNGNVEFLGHVTSADLLQKVYMRTDILLVTSHWETGPIVIWEAMAAGTLVVCSRYVGSGQEGALNHGENCLMFKIGDTQTAAEQVARLYAEPLLGEKILNNAWNIVNNRYSHEASIRQWHQVLSQVLVLPPYCLVLPQVGMSLSVGRLDRLVGESLAEFVRKFFQRTGPDTGAGGEWPHRISCNINNETYFWSQAQKEDFVER